MLAQLCRACRYGRTSLVVSFVDRGAAVNGIAYSTGVTPLHIAGVNGHAEVAELFCGAGAAIDRGKQHGETPLYIAAWNGHAEVAKLLCDAGADKDQTW